MPTSRNGSEISHTNGNKISANTANGQHSTNRMHHPINNISAFIAIDLTRPTKPKLHKK